MNHACTTRKIIFIKGYFLHFRGVLTPVKGVTRGLFFT